MHLPELLLVLKFDFLLTILISYDLKVSNSSPEVLTGHRNSVYIDIILANNASIYS